MNKPNNYPQEPKDLWNIFHEFTQRPRPSKHEDAVKQYVRLLAEDNGCQWKEDSVGNIVVYVPGTPGMENLPAVLIQNHLDMVCDHAPDKDIDFHKDPITTYVEDGWLRADRTTLGADNGIGCAAALACIVDKSIEHPPLELLFTIDEETGLVGATNLDPSLYKAQTMLNLDTEEWGIIYIGCAGGYNVQINGEFEQTQTAGDRELYQITLKGLRGGHSGIDIHMQQGNAAILLSELLQKSIALDSELVTITAGKAHNIIPREASALIAISKDKLSELETIIEDFKKHLLSYLPKDDHQLEIILEKGQEQVSKVYTKESFTDMLLLLQTLPHGAHKYNLDSTDKLVSLSSNLAEIKLDLDGKLDILSSVRFLDKAETSSIDSVYELLCQKFNLILKTDTGYPSWKPDFNNPLINLVQTKYKELFNIDAEVTAIHAGLECGILKDKLPHLNVISFGPDIRCAHTPSEMVNIESVNSFWKLFTALLASFKKQ